MCRLKFCLCGKTTIMLLAYGRNFHPVKIFNNSLATVFCFENWKIFLILFFEFSTHFFEFFHLNPLQNSGLLNSEFPFKPISIRILLLLEKLYKFLFSNYFVGWASIYIVQWNYIIFLLISKTARCQAKHVSTNRNNNSFNFQAPFKRAF